MPATSSAIYTWGSRDLMVLIPKRRGTGYLAQPLGHHYVAALSDLEISERIDICGLDGYLSLDYKRYLDSKQRAEIVTRVLPQLAKHYGFTEWRESDEEF